MNKGPLYGGTPGKVYPVTEERAAYNEALEIYANNPDPIAILPAQLRSEAVLESTANSFAFNLRANVPNPSNGGIMRDCENRLDINDAFMIRELAVLFGIEADGATQGALILQTFDNPEAAPLGFGLNAPAIQQAYNGRLGMTVNTVGYMEGLDMNSFRVVDTAQAGLQASAGVAPLGQYQRSAYDPKRGFRAMVPQINISGADKSQFIVSLPEVADFGAEDGYSIVAVLLCNGLRIQNGGAYRGA